MPSIFSTINLIEFGGLLFGLLYIYYAHKKSNLSWLFGVISAICIIVVDISKTHLFFDAILHSFFLLMSFIGLYLWYKGSKANKEIRISKMPLISYFLYLIISLLISGAAGYLLDQQTDAAYPYLDCFQMMLSIFATFLIIYCVVNAWSYWILVDIISIGLYFMTGAYLLALLYVAYLISNGLKWRDWSKSYKESKLNKAVN